MIILDTNVVIYFLQGVSEVVKWFDKQRKKEHFAISTMSVVELLGYTKATAQEIFLIERWLKTILVVDVDMAIAREAAYTRQQYGLTAIDSVVVATAIVLNGKLATRDKDCARVKEVKVLKV